MIAISEKALVSCYVNVVALVIMAMLQLVFAQLHWQKDKANRIFLLISICMIVASIMGFLTNAMFMQTAPWTHVFVQAARVVRELAFLAIVLFWVLFVYHKLYGDAVSHPVLILLALLPWPPLALLNVLNPWHGFLYTFSATNRFEPTLLLNLEYAFSLIFFGGSAILVWRYDRKEKKARFFRIMPMAVPVLLSTCAQLFTEYDIGIMSFAIGAGMLMFSMVSENRYMDMESGLYNRSYLAYLFDLATVGKYSVQSALILEAEGNLPACHEILKSTLHQEGDVIRTDVRKYLMFSTVNSLSTISYQAYMVNEATERHNASHPEETVRFRVRSRIRKEEEDAFTFLRTALDEEEGGDEIRGIASMISELDRLDKELKLAKEIQANILPRSFPDHTEYDIFASMEPAKEVGGDFYDFFLVDPDHLAMVIADVSGKGIPAALFMMASKGLIKNQLLEGQSPAEALTCVNGQLCERNAARMFVTVWAALVEISTGKGLSCNGGHEAPFLRRAGGRYERIQYKPGPFLGISRKARYQDRPFELGAGDSLFVYTDGVPEAKNASHEMFGRERLEAALNYESDAAPRALLENVKRAVDDFVKTAPQFDDLTMLSFQYLGPTDSPDESRQTALPSPGEGAP